MHPDQLRLPARGGARARGPRRIPFSDMAARRQQRLVNLVLLLLSTRQFITAERIRDTVEGYEVSEDAANPDEAFKRSFERDKAELRELGIPLETGRNSAFDTEDGYRIARKDFELPPIEFTADEAAAVGLAARLWSSATLASEARTALIKLRAAGIEIEEPPGADALPLLAGNEPALPQLVWLPLWQPASWLRPSFLAAAACRPPSGIRGRCRTSRCSDGIRRIRPALGRSC